MFFNIFSKDSFYVTLIKHLWRYPTPLNLNCLWNFVFLFLILNLYIYFFLLQVYCDDVAVETTTSTLTSEITDNWQSLEWQSFNLMEKVAFIVALIGIVIGMTISVIINLRLKKNYTIFKGINIFFRLLILTNRWQPLYTAILVVFVNCISFTV